ncbi:hypothetical protein BASA61_000397 [Batrachochytrium salamandrivorans]|nr:hypothetical protein BASA61_000397 [Batrachochytrium salamandrivorans]
MKRTTRSSAKLALGSEELHSPSPELPVSTPKRQRVSRNKKADVALIAENDAAAEDAVEDAAEDAAEDASGIVNGDDLLKEELLMKADVETNSDDNPATDMDVEAAVETSQVTPAKLATDSISKPESVENTEPIVVSPSKETPASTIVEDLEVMIKGEPGVTHGTKMDVSDVAAEETASANGLEVSIKDTIQIESVSVVSENVPKVDDTTESVQVDDTTESVQVDDTTESVQVDDTTESAQVNDTTESAQVVDTTESAQVDDTSDMLADEVSPVAETTDKMPAPAVRRDDRDVNDESSFRLTLGNLTMYATPKDIKKLLFQSDLVYRNVKKGPKWEYAIVAFDQEDQMNACMQKLQGFVYKKRVMEVVVMGAQRAMKPMRRGDEITEDDKRTPDERLLDQVTPLWRLPYDQQLSQKQKTVHSVLQNFSKEMSFLCNPKSPHSKATLAVMKEGGEISAEVQAAEDAYRAGIKQMEWVAPAKKANRGLLFPLHDIKPSPLVEGYRTKCEFSFGKDPNGEIAVGFLLGGFKNGTTSIMGPGKCLNISSTAKKIATILESMADSSKLQVYDRQTKSGFWRLAQVRTHTTGDNMLFLQISRSAEDADAEALALHATEKARILPYIQEHAEKQGITITSLLIQESDSHFCGFKPGDSFEVVHGSGVVTEKLFDYTFRISCDSFFQINTAATEVLYSTVKDLSLVAPTLPDYGPAARDAVVLDAVTIPNPESETPNDSEKDETKTDAADASNTVLLDLCCGTGTIGITLASHFKKVVGVDIVEEAIEDAILNAENNGVKNAAYLCGKVEDKIREVFDEHVDKDDHVVAILDPARVGVHSSVIQAIRSCSRLSHVIYIACDAKQACSNFVELCRPTSNRYRGIPFRPVEGKVVDLFPHTKPCEVVMSFARSK